MSVPRQRLAGSTRRADTVRRLVLPAISGGLLLLVLALPELGPPQTGPNVLAAYHGRVVELLDPFRPDPSGMDGGFLPDARVRDGLRRPTVALVAGLTAIGLQTGAAAVAMAPLIVSAPRTAVVPPQPGPVPSAQTPGFDEPSGAPVASDDEPGAPPIIQVGASIPVVAGPASLGSVAVLQYGPVVAELEFEPAGHALARLEGVGAADLRRFNRRAPLTFQQQEGLRSHHADR